MLITTKILFYSCIAGLIQNSCVDNNAMKTFHVRKHAHVEISSWIKKICRKLDIFMVTLNNSTVPQHQQQQNA